MLFQSKPSDCRSIHATSRYGQVPVLGPANLPDNRARKARGASAALALILLSGIAVVSAAITVFGPQTYKGTGRPELVKKKFNVTSAAGTFTLRVVNQGVSSAIVVLNGRIVLWPSDFHKDDHRWDGRNGRSGGRDDMREGRGRDDRDNDRWEPEWERLRNDHKDDGRDDEKHDRGVVTRLERPVTLIAGTNEILVGFRGRRGTSMTIEIVRAAGNSDTTPPTITSTVSPAPNTNGWNKSPVTVTFTCADAGSGIAICPPAITVSADGANQVVTGTAVDVAGNTAATSRTLNIDQTPPAVTCTQSPPANVYGWNGGPVVVTCAATDSLSGVAPGSLTPPITLSADGTNLSATGHATDLAGVIGSFTRDGINIDQTKPTIDVALSPPPNGSGYNSTAVTASFTCADAGSGVDTCPPDQVISTEGPNQTVSWNRNGQSEKHEIGHKRGVQHRFDRAGCHYHLTSRRRSGLCSCSDGDGNSHGRVLRAGARCLQRCAGAALTVGAQLRGPVSPAEQHYRR